MSKVLIADDELKLRKVVALYLTRNGCLVTEVGTGEDALKALKVDLYDAVVLDVRMPGMGGVKTCEKIKSDARFKGIPVILLTANTSSKDRSDGVNVGADAYITKPFSPKDLYQTIMSLKK